ncbi:MAG: hypothetical protein AAF546_00215 [Verrucomicrobiota bacterium]
MSYQDQIEGLMGVEPLAEDFFVQHLRAYTLFPWFSPNSQDEDIGDGHFFLSCEMAGSTESLASAAQTGTGQPERNVFTVGLNLEINTILEDIRDDRSAAQLLNLQQLRVNRTRAAMLHGNITNTQASCDNLEIIGWLQIGPTTRAISDSDQVQTSLSYTFDVGYTASAWPNAGA